MWHCTGAELPYGAAASRRSQRPDTQVEEGLPTRATAHRIRGGVAVWESVPSLISVSALITSEKLAESGFTLQVHPSERMQEGSFLS